MMKFEKFFNTRWFYRLLAAILAVVLFVYVNNDQLARRSDSLENSALTATTERTVSVPLELKGDTDKYFVTGYPEKVKVVLTGPTSLVTVSVNTMNFHIVADLTRLGPGTHRVRLTAEGLNKSLSYRIVPATTTITIAPRSTVRLPIQVEYNRNAITEGYEIGTPKLSTETAQVTGSEAEVARVAKLVAHVNIPAKVDDDIEQNVSLQAVDQDGKPLNVLINPATVRVTLPISASSKEVSIKTTRTGTPTEGLSYTLTPEVTRVRIYGSKTALAAINSLDVPVDVTNVTTSRTVEVPLSGLLTDVGRVTPETIKVQIKVSGDPAASSSSSQASEPNEDDNATDNE